MKLTRKSLEKGSKRGYLDGQMLIATPTMEDEHFARSLIYVCAHSSEGAMGIVVNQPAANIADHIPNVNIKTFGMCKAPTNPQVVTATAAALGVLTPQPCVPATPAPWAPGAATVMIANQPALDSTSKCNCTWLGVIEITDPGQTTTDIP